MKIAVSSSYQRSEQFEYENAVDMSENDALMREHTREKNENSQANVTIEELRETLREMKAHSLQRQQMLKTQVQQLIAQLNNQSQTNLSTSAMLTLSIESSRVESQLKNQQTKKRMSDLDYYDDTNRSLYSQFELKLLVKMRVDESLYRQKTKKV